MGPSEKRCQGHSFICGMDGRHNRCKNSATISINSLEIECGLVRMLRTQKNCRLKRSSRLDSSPGTCPRCSQESWVRRDSRRKAPQWCSHGGRGADDTGRKQKASSEPSALRLSHWQRKASLVMPGNPL